MNLESVPQAMWDEAERRARILRPLAERDRCPAGLIDAAAHDLDLSPRWVYRLVARLRAQHGAVTALLPQQGRGGPDRPRLAHVVETVIAEAIDTTFLQRQNQPPRP